MNLNATDLDKMMRYQNKRTAGRFTPVRNGRRFLRSFCTYSKAHLMTYLFAAVFLTGLLIGTLLVNRSSPETLEVLKAILGGYVEERAHQSFAGIVVSTFSSIFVSLLLLFFCGFCSISLPIIFAVPLFKGLGYGFSIGTLYAQYGTQALLYVSVLLFPAMFLGTLLLITACRTSTALSVTLFRSTLINSELADGVRIKRYCVKFSAFTVICLLIALFDALLYYKFGASIVL